jgi:hypothetical protein
LALKGNVLIEDATWEDVNSSDNMYKEVFKDGVLLKTFTTTDIRNNIKK